MIENLPEDFLYERLPEGLVELDQRGLIQAVVGGYQDRVEDLRSYSRKLELLFQTDGLPETGNNVVLVDVQSDQGKVYTRSLDIQSETPADGTTALTTWVLQQLEIGEDTISNVRYGRDLLRLVDANTIDYLAATIGAVLFKSSALTVAEQVTANHQLLQTYFPRLKIKGTADSFMTLGRILGFDDLKVTPLYGRLSPRIPNDIGNPANDGDFNAESEYQPQQAIDDFYNPLKTNDGPFFSWTGTVSPGTAATNFCTQVVNDKNPWVDVSVVRVLNGTVTYPSAGSYALGSSGSNSEGGPHKKAFVEAGDILFRAIGEGQYFNGIEIHVVDSGTNKIFTITDRLSAIKYRSSYFDLALTAEFDRVEELYGRSAMRRNKDLAANPTLTSDGTAVSPYRPWWAGSISTGSMAQDFLVMTGTASPTVITARVQSTGTDRQLNVDELVSAGVQVVQALEEVRPATRQPRKAGIGFLNRDQVGYAAHIKETVLLTSGTGTPFVVSATYMGYGGFSVGGEIAVPLPPYYAVIALEVGSIVSGQPNGGVFPVHQNGSVAIRTYPEAVVDPQNPNGLIYAAPAFSGSYDFASGTYSFTFTPPSQFLGTTVYALWHLTTTEVVRTEPTAGTNKGYQARPEDQDGTNVYEVADDFPWRRDIALGGEVVDLTIYNPITPDVSLSVVDPVMSVPGHDGADYDVFGINSSSGIVRLVTSPRSIGSDYRQGMPAVAYRGALKDLASVSDAPGHTELERLFETGAKLYTVGNVQGVLVADPNKFYSDAHRTSLIGWFPLNEHVDADLAPVDHSVCASNLTPINLDVSSRVWDTNRGWYLSANVGAALTSQKLRFVGDEFSLSFWIKRGTTTSTSDLLTYGPLRIQWNGTTNTLTFFNNATTVGSLVVGAGFKFVSFTLTDTSAVIGSGDLDNAISTSVYAGDYAGFTELDNVLTINGVGVGLSDLRMWSSIKTTAQLDSVRYYSPTDTQVAYQVGSFLSLNRRDRFALKVLACGLVEAAPLPAWYTVPRLGAAVRYNSLGLYEGESRFKEVGLGGGQMLPTTFKLGQQFYNLQATGDVVVSTTTGDEPEFTPVWGTGTYTGTNKYLKVIQTASESYDVLVSTGTALPWPNLMVASNPTRDLISVKGEDGFMYDVSLVSFGTGAALQAKLIARERSDAELAVSGFGPGYWDALRISEQPTRAQTVITAVAERITVLTGGTEVVQITDANFGILHNWESGSTYLNLNERTVANVTNAFDAWTDQSEFGSEQTPPVAALDKNGILEFETVGDVVPGNYRLTVVSGNIGKVDQDFDGFAVEITVDATVLQKRLCSGLTGFNFVGTDVFDFTIDNGVTGMFLTSFDWTNASSNPSRGEARQLAIHNFKIERLVTEVYKIAVSGAGSVAGTTKPVDIQLVNTGTFSGTVPGGWIAAMNSYGSVAAWMHESLIYPSNDTLTSKFPLSEMLTSTTIERREDILTPTNVVLVDSTPGTIPSFGTIAES
jgi:hypothetical protein